MTRAIMTAPVARDLSAQGRPGQPTGELGGVVKIPGATNGIVQAWDTDQAERYVQLADPAITIYLTRAAVPAALKAYLIQVLRSDSRVATVNARYVRMADLQSVAYLLDQGAGMPALNVPGDFFRVRSALGVVSVKLQSEVIAGDVPVDWTEVHTWAGQADTLGST